MQLMNESEYIELCRCLEKLRGIGMTENEAGVRALRCHHCLLAGRCDVSMTSIFLELRTC